MEGRRGRRTAIGTLGWSSTSGAACVRSPKRRGHAARGPVPRLPRSVGQPHRGRRLPGHPVHQGAERAARHGTWATSAGPGKPRSWRTRAWAENHRRPRPSFMAGQLLNNGRSRRWTLDRQDAAIGALPDREPEWSTGSAAQLPTTAAPARRRRIASRGEGRGMKKPPRTQRPGARVPGVARPAVSTGRDGGAVTSASAGPAAADHAGGGRDEGPLVRLALRFTSWAERWFPDAFVFVAIAVVVVAAGALAIGAPPTAVTKAFGDGFWSLIPFTMQMVFVTIGGYVVATSPPAQSADRPAGPAAQDRPRCGRLHRHREHARLAAELGPQPDLRRAVGPRRRAAGRPARRLPRRGCRGLSRPRRHLGPGPELLRGPAPGQRREPAQDAAADHRRDPVHGDHLPLAVDADRRRADRGLGRDRGLVGAVRRRCGDRARPRRRPHPAPRRPAAPPAAGRVARARAAADDPADRDRARLAGAGVRAAEPDRRDLEPEHLQSPVPHAGPAAALAAQALFQRGRAGRCRRRPAC